MKVEICQITKFRATQIEKNASFRTRATTNHIFKIFVDEDEAVHIQKCGVEVNARRGQDCRNSQIRPLDKLAKMTYLKRICPKLL